MEFCHHLIIVDGYFSSGREPDQPRKRVDIKFHSSGKKLENSENK